MSSIIGALTVTSCHIHVSIDVNVACKMNLSGNPLQFLNLSFNGQVV